ncbi:SGNH/GDSL hydrolase family protein [Niabella drilacis]|uniref:Lysophospholipase L1 n=1 Tax=Niabella drilacis (strain DSM 25811 / CCM 8410 / CCUG 62505 / LMG 26954 / E90) TaxID=1285928 RepID=A0A1G6M5B1_NIADE|nr:SGNH/GDSL hydrolase family protein [Niabella drilacis]SDC50156.1 Lysophospholipase L1 [Niabella drilacis]
MKRTILLGVTLLLLYPVRAQSVQPFRHGDRVALVGNSITHGGRYHAYLWLYYMTHFPNRRITLYNCGIGGDMAGGMLQRLTTDVFSKDPTIIFLTFGMNDSGYAEFLQSNSNELADKNVARSHKDYQLIEEELTRYRKAKKVIISSSPYDETAKISAPVYPGKNNTILRIADFQRASALTNQWGFIDLTRPITALNLKGQQQDSTFTLTGKDRIHPDVDGYLAMTYFILKAQGLAGDPVARVGIDVQGAKVFQSANCTVSKLSVSPSHIRFHYLANALPFPIDTAFSSWNSRRASDALKWIPFMEEFNNERFIISGLKKGDYLLRINGDSIGVWSHQQLAQGINLALQTNTPQYRQAEALRILNEDRWMLEMKLRGYYWIQYMYFRDKGMLFNDDPAAVADVTREATHNIYVAAHLENYLKGHHKAVRDGWIAEMQALTNKIYANNKPRQQEIEIVPLTP